MRQTSVFSVYVRLVGIDELSTLGLRKAGRRPFARSGHMVRNKLRWDANNEVGPFETKESEAGLVRVPKF